MNQNKVKVVFSGPPDTFSGYGARSRDLLKSLIKLKDDEWDIKVLSQRWGNTPFGALNPDIPADKQILDRIIPQMTEQPDIFMMCSVPNEMPQQRIGKYANWIFTAGVETTIMPAELLQGANNADLVIVSSEHTKKVFEQSSFEQINNQTKQKVADLKLTKPVEVLFEGCDLSVYKKLDNTSLITGSPLVNYLNEIKEEFCYLSVGHWLPGSDGEDRKQLTTLVKVFLETFKNKKVRPALILKSSIGGYSITEEEHLLDRIDTIRKQISGDLPSIYLLHGELADSEMNILYNHPKVKAFALCGSEGFGRPFLEFSAATGKPIITSPWSGQTDFLTSEFSIFVGGSLGSVHPSAANQFLLTDAQWFKVDPYQLSLALKEIYDNYKTYVDRAKRQGYRCRTEFSLDKMTEKLDEIIKKHMPVISRPMPISLPKLSRHISLPDNA